MRRVRGISAGFVKDMMMRLAFHLLAAATLCFGLVACSSAPPKPVYPDLRFDAQPPLRLDVAQIQIQNDFQPTYRAPNVEHLFPVPPARAVETWARDRLRAVGQNGIARFTIHNASVTQTDLKQTPGIAGAFTTEPSERYDMTVQVTLDIMDNTGRTVRTANVTSTRSQSILNNVTPTQREQSWYDMTGDLMVDFDRRMTGEIRNSFGLYYVR